MPRRTTASTRLLAILVIAGAAACVALVLSVAGGQDLKPTPIAADDVKTCMRCHTRETAVDVAHVVNLGALSVSPHKDLKCQDCHSSITGAPHTPAMLKEKAACGNCHTDQHEAYSRSAHAKPDKVAGDHPTCVWCHGHGDPHAINGGKQWPRAQKVAVCSECHRQKDRMGRYGPDTDAVSSYEKSFHGKALLRYGNLKVAICTDCHGHHDILPPSDPAARTGPANAAKTCSQAGCHAGAKVNFAMSGANHLDLKVKKSAVLKAEEFLFKWLTAGTIVVLLLGVALDLRREVFHRRAPASGRVVGFLISLSYLFIVAALAMAVFGVHGVRWSALAALILMGQALAFWLVLPRTPKHKNGERVFLRFTWAQRIQHICLALSFTALVLTGMPLRYADAGWLRAYYVFLGGMTVMRVVHRIAAVVMMSTWAWHTGFLFYRWKKTNFKLSAWTMLPTLKDVHDVLGVAKYYLGLAPGEPKYERFQFREKFDYFAVYWGMPIMVLSGLVLWFPIYFGNMLPDVGLAAAYIAHSDEALLAFLAILTWHFYNTHFNLDHFPMNSVWYKGTLTRSEMEQDHALELERLERAGQAPAESEASGEKS